MSYKNAHIAIENRLATNFTACTVTYENVKYNATADTTFAACRIVDSGSRRMDIGTNNPLHRSFGLISVNIHVPKNTGVAAGRNLADQVAAVFRDTSFSSVTCQSPVVRNVGEVEGWYVVNMTCPFFTDTIYS